MNELLSKYPDEIQQILANTRQSANRSAVMPLLYLAQRESGYITKQSIAGNLPRSPGFLRPMSIP